MYESQLGFRVHKKMIIPSLAYGSDDQSPLGPKQARIRDGTCRSPPNNFIPRSLPRSSHINPHDWPASSNNEHMSVDINWETLTGGPDGAELAETIRRFVHERFQTIPLPKLIRSVSVHGFDFGKVSPEITLKDITDPLPDFYETDEGEDAQSTGSDEGHDKAIARPDLQPHTRHVRGADGSRRLSEIQILERASNSALSRGAAPGVLGTTSNLGYFHLPLSAGLPGSQTPLAAVAGAHYAPGNHSLPTRSRQPESFSSASPPSAATPTSSQGPTYFDRPTESHGSDEAGQKPQSHAQEQFDRNPEDLQVVFHVTYAGDVRLSLTAEVFLDYPMPSFVGIPLKLRITGLTFNGVGILAYIKKRAHLCFLNPEDAEALVGGEHGLDSFDDDDEDAKTHKVGGLLEEIKIESEMGGTDGGKQVLKNVDKIEKFILEQVRRIFEDEFVYPSFWTFLV